MKSIKASLPFFVAASLFSLLLLSHSVQAQAPKQQPEENQTLQALLNEIRLLHKTLQRTGLNASRSQIILDRMKAHQEQVVRLTRTLDDVRAQTDKIEATIPRFLEQNKILEAQIERETDLNKRGQMEFEVKDKKLAVARYRVGLEQQREREQQLTTELRAQQAKLTELENRLDALEREMENEVERLRTPDTPVEKKKQP